MATGHVASMEIHLRLVVEGIFNGIIIEILIYFISAVVPTSLSLCLDWPGILHPATLVDIVYEEVAERPSA